MVTKALPRGPLSRGGKSTEVEQLLKSAVTSRGRWRAIRFGDGSYGIFEVFADNGARFAPTSPATSRAS